VKLADISRTLREHLRDKINKLASDSENKDIRKPYFSGYGIEAK
jgi:uncharacterized caspase-like protein